MSQFIVRAWDYPDALERRLAARAEHLAKASELHKQGSLLLGAALLNEAGDMIGSELVFEYENEEALRTLLQADAYMTNRVWERVEIRAVRVVKF